MTHDFYDLLDVSEDASQEDIKEAFRSRVQEVHPDLNDDPRAPAQFTALKKGYDTLNDPVERKAYDRLGHRDYVAKRLEGLPDPDQWKPANSEGDGSEGTSSGSTGTTSGTGSTGTTSGSGPTSASGTTSTSGSTKTSGTTNTTSTGTSESAGSSGSSTSSTGAGTATGTSRTSTGTASGTSTTGTTGASTGTTSDASASTRTNTRTSTGSATGTTGSATRTGGATASGSATGAASEAATGTKSGADDATANEGPGLIERIRSINYGWPLVFLTAFVYLAGVALYAREHVGAIQEFAIQVSASGADVAALRGALLSETYGFTSLFEFVQTTALVESRPGAGALIAAGAALMPLIIFVVVRTTRKAFAWQPTYLYVVAVLAPAAGLAANAAGVDRPVLTVVAFGVLPLCAIVALPFNAFVTPRLKRLF